MSQVEQPMVPSAARRKRKRLLWNGAGLLVGLVAILSALLLWINSNQFENLVRGRIIAGLEEATGGRVEIRSFNWKLTELKAEAAGILIHGLEDAGEAPYAQIENLHVRISVLGFFSPRILLRELDVVKPQVHLIVYPDGSTNQPQPAKRTTPKKPVIDTLFDLRAAHVSVEQGGVDFDSRATGFDSLNRYLPLEFEANDASITMKYVPAQGSNPETYHIDAGVRDVRLFRGGQTPASELHAYIRASVDLARNGAYLRSLEVAENVRGEPGRVLNFSGTLSDFTHARWEAKASGEFDMRLLKPILDYPFTPEGVARMNLVLAGDADAFRIDGPIHLENGAYVAPGLNLRKVLVDTKLHVDPNVMHFGATVIRFAQGGQVEGDLELQNWAPHLTARAVSVTAAPPEPKPVPPRPAPPKSFWKRPKNQPSPPPPAKSRDVLVKDPDKEITVHGKITSNFQNVALDTLLDIVGKEPFTRLGLNTTLNGPASAEWVQGEVKTLTVKAGLALKPSSQPFAGEAPGMGAIDGTYSQRTGVVDLHQFELDLPASHIEAQGRLGAYPLTSATDLKFGFRSRSLAEFDKTLRDLGLRQNGKAGSEALPVALTGEAEFQGRWTGSLVSPQLAGNLKATQVGIELPPNPKDPAHTPQLVRWDLVEASGSYDAERIAILRGRLIQGQEQISLDGTLSAPHSGGPAAVRGNEKPGFNADSLLRAHVRAAKVDVKNVLPLLGIQAPVTGTLEADFQTEGRVTSLGGSGWVEFHDGAVYGEPLSRVRAEGTIADNIVKVSSYTITGKAGSITGAGNYDLHAGRFQADARGAGIDMASIQHLHTTGQRVAGKLEFTATASGTMEDPRVDAHAAVTGLSVDGDPLGLLEITAHSLNRRLVYDATSVLETAQLVLHGQTEMSGDFQTQAKIDFSRANIGALLRLAHLEALKGESSLSGTATVQGPLTRLEALQGEVKLQNMAVTVAGVHLQGEGALHATLANARVNLDPLHVTGEETDLRMQGSLELREERRLDFAASGSINLKLAETIDSDLTAGGTTTFQVEAHGPLANPNLRGRIEFENGSLALEDVPNGLSQLHGTLEFNQNRLEVRSLTAMTGGGLLSLGGYLAYKQGVFADLSVTGKAIRIRYPQGVSSLADTTLHLQGTQSSLLLSGNVMITRFSVSPDLDMAALATQANAVQPVVPPEAPSNHIRLDVRVQSSPQLNFQNAYAKLAGDVDLRLRGTLASPSLLGRISITEGNATIAGTRYELQRGDILFTNPVRIQPNIDLNATARVQDYDITLGLHGTPDKLSVMYRSDPPLPQGDVIALLALGRTQSEQGLYTQQQEQAGLSPSTDVLLGGALNATVSSRAQKLFGVGSVKVDPSYIGALGVSTTRITVDQQLGKRLTLTYATNVDTSAQQFLQAEIAVNRHVSLLVTRDESDVFSIVVKATRRYR